jgi:hypothetical protein
MTAHPAQAAQSASESYQWHAELVAFEENSRMVTVKSRAVGDALKQLGNFKPGDKIMLTWSGFDKFAYAINGALRYDASKAEQRFSFPTEFVAFDSAGEYVTFKAQIPASNVTKVRPIKPGQWVTATSPHGQRSGTQPITAIRGYNDPEDAASS